MMDPFAILDYIKNDNAYLDIIDIVIRYVGLVAFFLGLCAAILVLYYDITGNKVSAAYARDRAVVFLLLTLVIIIGT